MYYYIDFLLNKLVDSTVNFTFDFMNKYKDKMTD